MTLLGNKLSISKRSVKFNKPRICLSKFCAGLPIRGSECHETLMRRIILNMGKRGTSRGQVTILFAMIFTTLMVLCLVVDFSHLVHSKMNLQIAADSAAYAGAAWQARTLNRIAQVNYRLRQDLKEMVMRLQVTHLRHNRNFPRGDAFINGAPQVPQTELFVCQQAHGYVSLSGLRYRPDTNLCRNASPSSGGLPPIAIPPVIASFDPFAIAIQAQIRKINDAAQDECRAAAEDNRILSEHLRDVFTKRSQYHAQQAMDLAAWLNEVGSGTLTDQETNPIRRVAWESATRNLAPAARDNFQMQILLPSGGEYIRLNKHNINGTIFYIRYNVEGQGCVGRPSFIDFTDMVASVTKDQPIITFFSVKLSAKPKLMFMPQAWVDAVFPTMEAFASAKPFGSRIGPDGNADLLTPVANRPGNNNRIMNFSFKPGDQMGILNTKLMAFLTVPPRLTVYREPHGNEQTGWPMSPGKSAESKLPLLAIRSHYFRRPSYTVYPIRAGNTQTISNPTTPHTYPDYMEASDPNGNLIDIPKPLAAVYNPSSVGSKNKGQGYVQIDAADTGGGPYGNYAAEGPASHSVVLASDIQALKGKAERIWLGHRRPGS